ncbi:Rrf2 family protein [Succinivibrio dextrinosolvens]|uniref:Rrf2 family transcriptional regulator n=1 Tax=Succinivibrio dextrinosolvens TaxID=83771 RepID=UPI0008E9762D|nr:Rrf2 family transcriptional regulator [Succinivibrio dextrinosolvens]SFS36071.1 Rrf2 family protein [Succinivibrio dextrinosolvens]
MHFSTKFTIAVHTLLCIDYFKDEKCTSEFIASSVGVNPVIIRRILGALKKADLVKIEAGKGGASLSKLPSEINLYDVLCAVEDNVQVFSFHEKPEPKCPVGAHIHDALDVVLFSVDECVSQKLKSYTLDNLTSSLSFAIKKG